MSFTLYNAPQSTCSQRVRFVLHAKGLSFDEHKLDLFSGDQLKPDYLKINPNGVVPTLLHDGGVVTDSSVIMEYLEEIVPQTGVMMPADPLRRGHMRALMRFIDEMPAPAIRVPSYNLAFLPRLQKMTKEEFAAFAESKPLRKEFMLAMGQTGFPQKEMDTAMDRLRRTVVRMDAEIASSGGPWLLGNEISLADVSVMPVIVRLADLKQHQLWQDKPSIARWLDLVRAEPAYSKTYYHGTHLTELYPHLRERASA
ncbi:MAG: glutathione S-transferase family protein [Pseudorhodoplanes sp.]